MKKETSDPRLTDQVGGTRKFQSECFSNLGPYFGLHKTDIRGNNPLSYENQKGIYYMYF